MKEFLNAPPPVRVEIDYTSKQKIMVRNAKVTPRNAKLLNRKDVVLIANSNVRSLTSRPAPQVN